MKKYWIICTTSLQCLEDSLHNTSHRGNTIQEVASWRTRIIAQELSGQRKTKLLDQEIRIWDGSIKLILRVLKGQSGHAPSQTLAENQLRKVQSKHLVSLWISKSKIPKFMKKTSKFGEYDGKGVPDKNLKLVNDRLNYFIIDDVSKCKLFTLTLIRPSRLWFNGLPDRSITSLTYFYEWLLTCFTIWKRWLMAEACSLI